MKSPLANVSLHTLLVSAFVLIVMSTIGIQAFMANRGKPDIDVFREFLQAVNGPIQGVEISDWPGCANPFDLRLSDDQRKYFLAAAASADQVQISGHSGPILEAKLVFETPNGPIEYYTTVNKYEPDHLFLRRVIRANQPDGSQKEWRYHELRIPNLGKWIFSVAPRAAL